MPAGAKDDAHARGVHMDLAEELIPTIMLNIPMPDSKSILDLLLMGRMHLTINSTVRASMTKGINGMRP